jgi:hypothetical protein
MARERRMKFTGVLSVLKRERQKLASSLARIDGAIASLVHGHGTTKGPGRRGKRMSAAVKARIARTMKANWKAKRATGKA